MSKKESIIAVIISVAIFAAVMLGITLWTEHQDTINREQVEQTYEWRHEHPCIVVHNVYAYDGTIITTMEVIEEPNGSLLVNMYDENGDLMNYLYISKSDIFMW